MVILTEFSELLESRRSVYNLGKETDLSQEEIVTGIRHAVHNTPSAFNSQTSRVVVLFDEAKTKFWDHVYETQKDLLPEQSKDFLLGAIENARDEALGTALVFEDHEALDQMPSNETRTNVYKDQNSAMVHYAIWLRLKELNLGASLQHFNLGYEQGFDAETRKLFDLPDTYELVAELPFGSIKEPAQEKDHIDTHKEVQVRTETSN